MAGLGPAIHDSGATGPPGKNHPTHRLRCDTLRGLAAMQVAELPDAPQKSKGHTGLRSLEDNALLLLVFAISLAFACILWPFFGALLWAAVLAIVFTPLHEWMLHAMPKRQNLPALATVLIILTLVILPLTLIAASLCKRPPTFMRACRGARGIPARSSSNSLPYCRLGQPTFWIASG